MSNLMKKIFNIFSNNKDDDESIFDTFLIDPIEKLDKTNTYPISQYEAFQIANKNCNLKTDFYRNTLKNISYLYFSNCDVDLKTINDKKYWQIKITDGEISWLEYNEDETDSFNAPIFCDGYFGEDDFEKLQCLVDVETGEYTYFPVK